MLCFTCGENKMCLTIKKSQNIMDIIVAQLAPLPNSCGRFTRYSNRLDDFSVVIPRCYKDFYVNS